MGKSKNFNNMLAIKIFEDILRADEVLERTVIKFGNSGRINVPNKHIGKTVKLIILNEEESKT